MMNIVAIIGLCVLSFMLGMLVNQIATRRRWQQWRDGKNTEIEQLKKHIEK
ncbi:hypothetical protein [Paraferrimonas sp. SM1919]|uniref:hypothetical protein n=1 Tax=Paraferrimonas sp. SM1919 TaxID=2662263 RepID=UPI0013D77F46|nr:hypothetical protein [Paraferrimonas sp. SM1919]